MKKGGKKKEPQFNPADYAYMDNMPLEGWIWEFIRRSPTYKTTFEKGDRKLIPDKLEPLYRFSWTDNFKKYYKNILENGVSYKVDYTMKTNEKTPPIQKCILLEGIPNPKYNYNDFPNSEKPDIRTSSNPIICMSHKELQFILEIGLAALRASYDECPAFKKVPESITNDLFNEKVDKLILNNLSPNMDEDNTLYVGITRTAKIKDIEKVLMPEIKKYLKRSSLKERDDKWKYYLAAFDFFQDIGEDYALISDYLYSAFPFITVTKVKVVNGKEKKVKVKEESLNFFSTKNAKNFYLNALDLINGGYKKYCR